MSNNTSSPLKRTLPSSTAHFSGHEQADDLNLSMGLSFKRMRSDGQDVPGAQASMVTTVIRPSSNVLENENMQTPSQDSGYSGSQRKAFEDMNWDNDHNSSDTQSMDIDHSPVDQVLLNINVDEDSSQEHRAIESKTTDDKIRKLAENVLYCSVSIGRNIVGQQKKEKNQRKKEGKDNKDSEDPQDLVAVGACALLNEGGGILVIKLTDFQSLSHNSVDTFWKNVEPKLTAMVEPSSYSAVFDVVRISDELRLFIKAPGRFCTVKYNLFLPRDSSALEASHEQTMELLQKHFSQQGRKKKLSMTDVPLKDLSSMVPERFTYQQRLTYHESRRMQFKDFRSTTYLGHNNHKQRHGVGRWISAFANGSGGVILLGVTDEGCVSGLDLNEENSQKEMEERISSLFNAMVCNRSLERKAHWDIAFIPVIGNPSNTVIAITVAGMASFGGVFTNYPKSFTLKVGVDGGNVACRLEFEEWKKRLLSEMDLQSNSKAMNAVVEKFKKLRVSKGHLLTVKGDVQRIRDAFFAVTDEIPVMPEGFELNLPEDVKAILKAIQKKVSKGRNRGLLVASRSWLSNVEGKPMDGVICDLLLVSRNFKGLHLLTLCNADDDGKFLQYSRHVAQKIKTSLAKDGACWEKFCIFSHVVQCRGGTGDPLEALDLREDERFNAYPTCYNLNSSREKLNEVLKSLVIILASVKSTLSSNLGVTIMNLLTKEQFELVHEQIEVNRELWIKGPAGTGKTLVAVEFMRELMRREKLTKEEILCVCENAGIKEHISNCNVCEVVSRHQFERRKHFPEVKHVVMDEAHNYEVSQGRAEAPQDVLYQKARRLVRQHDPNRPGYLWVFSDKSQTNHAFPSGMPDETRQRPTFRLRKVIRNSKKIFLHAKKYLTEENVEDALEMGHDFDGEQVQLIPYKAVGGKPQLDIVNKTIQNLFAEGYSNGDIAVLYRKNDCIPGNGFTVETVTAEKNRSNDVVVSSVLKYSGLERPVIVLVDVEEVIPWGRKRDPFIYCAVTRAMVKLVIIRCS